MQLGDIPTVSWILILTGLMLGVGLAILGSLERSDALTETLSVVNDSFAVPAPQGNVTLTYDDIVSLSRIINGTGSVVSSTNYSLTVSTGKLQWLDNVTCKTAATCYADYTWRNNDTAQVRAVQNTITSIDDLPSDWIPVIVIVVAAAIIIGLLFSAFRTPQGR